MAFSADFQYSTTSNPNQLVLSDTSVGSDAGLTGRTISLFLTTGALLTGATIPWAIGQSSITLNVLDKDYSLQILVTWQSSAPLAPPSTYTKQKLFTSTGNLLAFNYYLVQQMTGQPNIISDTDFMSNLGKLETEIDNAGISQIYGDQFSAQSALDRGFFLQKNQNYFF